MTAEPQDTFVFEVIAENNPSSLCLQQDNHCNDRGRAPAAKRTAEFLHREPLKQ